MNFKKDQIIHPIVAIIALLIMLSCGAIIVGEILKYPPVPDSPFIIQDKKIIDYHPQPVLFWWTEKMYLYQFNASYGDYGWIEVPDFFYGNYSIVDLYPNTWVIYH